MQEEFHQGLQKLGGISGERPKFTPIKNDQENSVTQAIQDLSEYIWSGMWQKFLEDMKGYTMTNQQDQIDLLNGRIRRLREQYQRDRHDANYALTSLQMDLQRDSFHNLAVTDGSVDMAKTFYELVEKLNDQRKEIDENLATLHALTGSV